MLAGGEDPLTVALAAKDAYHFMGSPEGELAPAAASLVPAKERMAWEKLKREARTGDRGMGTGDR